MTVTGLLFVIGFFAGLGLAVVRNPMYGLFTYVAVFYLHPPSRWWGHFLPDLRWSLLAAAVTLLVALRYRSPEPRPSWISTTPARLLLVYTLWLWIQSFWAIDQAQHLECCILFTKYLAVFYMVYHLIDSPEKARAFLFVHLAGCLYLGTIAYSTGGGAGGRLDGVGGPGIDDSNTLGMQMGTAAAVGLALMIMETRWWMGFCAVASAFALNTLVMTGSRGAFLALLAGGLTLVYLHAKRYRKKFVVIGVVGVLAFGAVASQQFWERMNTLHAVVDENEQLEDSAESRIVIAKAQLEMAKGNPAGYGHRGTEALSARYMDRKWLTESGARSSHNTFLTALVEQGIAGAVMYLAFVAWGIRSMLRIRPILNNAETATIGMYAAAAMSGLAVVLVAGEFADFLKVEVQIWLAALVASLFQCAQAWQERTSAAISSGSPGGGAVGTAQWKPAYKSEAARNDAARSLGSAMSGNDRGKPI